METFERRHAIHLTLISTIVIFAIPMAVFLVYKLFPLSFSQVVGLASALGTILLSAVLAYLYLQMWGTQEERTAIHENQEKILDRQVQIQENQQDILETEKEAILDVSNAITDNDACALRISNHGASAVVESHLRTILHSDMSDHFGASQTTQLFKIRDDGSRGGKVIGPEEKGVKMRCCPDFSVALNDNTEVGPFSEISTYLMNNGIDGVTVSVDLVGADEYGNPIETNILNATVDLHRNMELSEISEW